jgi:outer membrane protein
MRKLVKVALIVAGLSLTGTVVNAQQKIGHINSSELIQSMPEVKAADAAMDAWQKQKQATLEALNTEFVKKNTAFTDKQKIRSEANKDVVDKELQTMYTELQDMEKRIGAAQEQAQQEAKTKQEELYNPIIQKATTAVNSVSKEKGYAYVLDTSNPAVVYFGGGEDIIQLVKTKLGITTAAAKP